MGPSQASVCVRLGVAAGKSLNSGRYGGAAGRCARLVSSAEGTSTLHFYVRDATTPATAPDIDLQSQVLRGSPPVTGTGEEPGHMNTQPLLKLAKIICLWAASSHWSYDGFIWCPEVT